MRTNRPEYPIACPLFAEWKLNDAIREFRETMRVADTITPTGIPLPTSIADPITENVAPLVDMPAYLPLLISGYHHCHRGRRFSFALRVAAGEPLPAGIQMPPADISVTPSSGYLATLLKMHRHGFPLTGWDASIAKALAALSHRKPAKKYHRCRPLLLSIDATRIILPGDDIYDLPLGRILNQEEAASETILRQSHAAYRRVRGYECTARSHTTTPEIFLTADLHFGHRHAIRYYSRPFLPDDTGTMDCVLTNNWNHTIAPDDHVIFAGDFTYKADQEQTDAYRSPLNGTITWIEGNHDTCLDDAVASHTFTADGHAFLVIHNPKHVPSAYQGWVIHGHTHNARLGEYPFISFTKKTVNISTDVTGYLPVPLTEILALIREGEKTGRTTPILTREMSPNPEKRF